MTTKRDFCKISIYRFEFLFLIFWKFFHHFANNDKQYIQSSSYSKCRRWLFAKLLKTQNKCFFSSLIYWFNLHQTSKDSFSSNYQKLFVKTCRWSFDFVALIFSFIHWNFVIILRKTLCSSLRLILKNWSLSINDFHDDYESNSIMIHVNNVFEASFRFIDVEKILKKLLLAIDDFFAKWHIINKISYFETQQFAEKSKWHCSQIQRKNLNNDDSTYQVQLTNSRTFRLESIIRICWIL